MHPAFARSIARTGAVLSLLLAAIGLAADAGEYPHLGVPGLRAFAATSLPLLATGILTLAAVDRRVRDPRALRLLALGANVVLFVWSLGSLGRGVPPFFPLRAVVAAILAVAAAALLRQRR